MKTLTTSALIRKAYKCIALSLFGFLFSTSAFAASISFNGTTNSDWATATNWSTGTVPVAGDIVTIGSNKTVIISNGTTVSLDYLVLNSGASLTNNGSLTIAPVTASKSALTLNGTSIFNNTSLGSLTINTTGTAFQAINLSGSSNVMTFNGTIGFTLGATLIAANTSSSTLISGAGFTLGSLGSPVGVGLATLTSAGASLTIDAGTTLTTYNSSSQVFYMSSSTNVINNGTLNMYTTATGTSVHAINIWQTSASVASTFTNNGTVLMSGFEQPTVFGGANTGSTGYCQLINVGTLTSTYPGVSSGTSVGALGINSSSNLPNVFSNSGTMNLNASSHAIALNPKAYNGSFTNTGTITITKGNIMAGGTLGTSSTYQTLDNNSGGVINFNYGVAAGTTSATDRVIINNNSGATINGSCTFPDYALVTNAGSTLSPGDYTGGVSGIGTMVLTPSATGTKFPLYGNLYLQLNGKTTSGTDYDRLNCTEMDITNATISATAGYTPALSDYIPVVYIATSKTGPFSSSSLPAGWIVDNTSVTNVALKYYPSVPGAPTAATATQGDAQASVAFTVPASDGGASITTYTVTSNPGSITATGTSSPIIVTGLTNGTAYTFTVTATNIRGTSTASTASNSVTPAAEVVTTLNTQNADGITIENRVINFNGAVGTVSVFNSVGNLVLSQKVADSKVELKSAGFYLIKLETVNGVKVQKVLVK